MSLPPPPPPPQEEEIPELEIDVDELLDMESDDTRAARVKVREGLRGSRDRSGKLGVEGCLEVLPFWQTRLQLGLLWSESANFVMLGLSFCLHQMGLMVLA